jgi:sec-independent protein translocase protein TatA
MGMSVTQLLIILVIVIVLFGTKRLKNLGTDLGGAIRGFRSAMKEGADEHQITEKKSDSVEEKSETQIKEESK